MVTKDVVRPQIPLTRVYINHVTALAEYEIVMRQHVMRNFIWVWQFVRNKT
jgi:hypothetical protein